MTDIHQRTVIITLPTNEASPMFCLRLALKMEIAAAGVYATCISVEWAFAVIVLIGAWNTALELRYQFCPPKRLYGELAVLSVLPAAIVDLPTWAPLLWRGLSGSPDMSALLQILYAFCGLAVLIAAIRFLAAWLDTHVRVTNKDVTWKSRGREGDNSEVPNSE